MLAMIPKTAIGKISPIPNATFCSWLFLAPIDLKARVSMKLAKTMSTIMGIIGGISLPRQILQRGGLREIIVFRLSRTFGDANPAQTVSSSGNLLGVFEPRPQGSL